ncbi:Ig domain-containing protein [Streptococcus criceti]|uniref:Ig domain-containing protein n=1 Tax=Streptococcus criceti TaxID=1333 RepID=UPI001559BFC9|nr:Ig domain-containing protein [Streptococcus criceti]
MPQVPVRSLAQPDNESWTDDSDESHDYTVTITATDGAGNSTTKDITITVQRDTDGDGQPDVTDPDDDNDGIPDDKDKNPKVPDSEGPSITAGDKTVNEKTPFEVPVTVTDNDDPAPSVEVTGLPDGVTYAPSTGKITGSADNESWTDDSDESHDYTVTITATDGAGNSTTKDITITVQRDTDGDGQPDVTDPDDDNDGIPDDKDKNPKVPDSEGPSITAGDKTVNEKTPFEVPVTVTDNDDPAPSVEVTGLPDGVTYAPSTGKITGSADNESWTDDSDESHDYTVTITATDGAGNSTTKDITITVQRDTDGDGQPDVTDPDDDNDGIPDDKDKNPKVPDSEGPSITAGDKTVNEKTPFEVPVTVTDNDDPAPSVEVTGLPDGVTYAPSTGKITGSADNESWTDDSDESHDYTVTITATDGAGNSTTKDITITVQRDTDGDGQPDVTDPDDDNDGIPDDKDKNPKVPDSEGPSITAGDKTVNEKTPFEVPVTVTDNDDPAPSVEVTGLPDGVTYAPSTGKITGSADNESWTDDSDESHDYTVTITATDGAGNSTTKDITITVQRDTDGDGQPDVTDPDDDNDGIPDDKDKNPKVPDSEGPSITAGDKTVNEKTPFEVPVTVTDNDDPAPSVEVTGLPDGVTYAPSTGKITGSADNESWTDDSDESHDYTVTITATDGAGNSTTKDITITVQRDTDGDGQPDVTDPDDDNDGIPDDKDKNPKVPDSEGPSITAGDKTVNEKTPFEVPVTVTDNDDPAPSVEVTGLPDGVTYAPSTGKITGSADNESWTDDSDESHDYTVTITATDGAGNSTTKDITITVQRDTDGDGQPDVTDPDDDNDGIPDDKDKNPKVPDSEGPSITAGDKTVNEKTPFEVPVTVTDNDDPAPSVEVTGLPRWCHLCPKYR